MPGQYEDHPAVLGAGNEEASVGGGKACSQHQVGSGADAQQRRGAGIVQAAQVVDVGPGRVQHHPRPHVPRAAVEAVAHGGAGEAAGAVLDQSLDGDVVGQRRTMLRRGQGQRQIHARVVELAVVVDYPTAQVAWRAVAAHLLAQIREPLLRLLARHEFGAAQRVATRQAVVQVEADAVVGLLAQLVQGYEDRQLVHQMRGQLQQRRAFAQRLAYQAELRAVDTLDRLLQIADSAVYQLGAATAGAAGEVGALHQRDSQTAGGGVQGAAATRRAATDHQQVEALVAQPAQVAGTRHSRPR